MKLFKGLLGNIGICVAVIIWGSLSSTSVDAGFEQKNPLFSLKVKNETLKRVFEKLSEVSDYEIQLNGDWKDEPLSIELEKVSLEEAVRRCLKDFDHVAIWSLEERQVSIKVLKRIRSKGAASGKGEPILKIDRLPGASTNRKAAGDLQPSKKRGVSISGGETDFVQGTRTTIDSGDLQPSKKRGVSISGGETDFVQGTRTTID